MPVSKNDSVPFIGIEPIEAKILGEAAPELAQPDEQFGRTGNSGDFEQAFPHNLHFDVVAFLQAERLDHCSRQQMARLLPHLEICMAWSPGYKAGRVSKGDVTPTTP